MFDWAMRDDPVLGPGSYGQTSRLCPERAFVMHKLLSNLENGGWRSRPAFREFLEVLEGVQYAGSISAGGREYVEKVPGQFLETYRFFLNRHALTPWTSPLLVVFVLGGNHILAKYCVSAESSIEQATLCLTLTLSSAITRAVTAQSRSTSERQWSF
jgi:hypothetical protein